MNFTLLGKELRQHGWAIVLLGAVNLFALFALLALVWDNPAFGTRLVALQGQLWFLAVAGMLLGNRLVVAEYHAQTQLFLEALPLPRWRVFMVKYLLGLAVIAVLTVTTFSAVVIAAAPKDDLGPPSIALLLTRYAVFAWLTYGFFFMAGFLGKYRWAFFIFILLGIFAISSISDVELKRSPPFSLVFGNYPLELENWPVEGLLFTGALIAGTFVVSLLLACVQEGSIAGKLGERISYREKISIIVLLIGTLYTIITVGEKKAKEPYDTPGASVGSVEAITVKVSPPSAAAEALAQRLAEDLGAMADFLDIDKLSPVFITDRRDLDADRFETGYLPGAEGITMRTHFSADEWSYVNFLEYSVGRTMDIHSNGRNGYEPAFWIIDGFCLYWAHRRAGEGADAGADPIELEGPRRGLWLRALYGSEGYAEAITRDDHLHRWFAWQGLSGHHITAGVGWSGLVTLRAEVGEEKFRDFLRASLGRATPRNALTTLEDILNPPEQRLAKTTGLDYDQFLPIWNAQLDRARETLADDLRHIPRLDGSLDFIAESAARRSFTAEYEFTAPRQSADLERPVLLYYEPLPFYTRGPESLFKRYPLSLEPGIQRGQLYEDYSAGARVSHTFSAHHRVMGCRIISGWELTEIR